MGSLPAVPLTDQVAAVSCGLVGGVPVLDLDYAEDSTAGADANFVLTGAGGLVEIQATAEDGPFAAGDFDAMMNLARAGVADLVAYQKLALGLA